jgi:streptogramin lyase
MSGDTLDTIYKVSPTSGKILDSFPSPGKQPEGLAFDDEGMLWNVDGATGTIYQLDPTTGRIRGRTTVLGRTTGTLVGLAHDGTSLWVNDALNIHQVKP